MSSSTAASTASRGNLYTVFGLAAIGLLAYLDWITHRQPVVAILLALGAGGAIVFRERVVEALKLGPFLAQIPAPARPVLAAAPALLYFLIRGQGTSGSGGVVIVAMLLTVGVVAVFGRVIDARLAGFYAARNRILPLVVRMILALVAPILIAFLVIHGSLADLPALWGGTTNHPMSPTGREGLFLLGSLLSAASAFLLLREGQPSRVPKQTPREVAPPVGQAAWSASHAVPLGGLPAWRAPDPSGPVVANLEAGLPVQVVAVAGDWAQVMASNGWMGWVDGRRLTSAGGGR